MKPPRILTINGGSASIKFALGSSPRKIRGTVYSIIACEARPRGGQIPRAGLHALPCGL